MMTVLVLIAVGIVAIGLSQGWLRHLVRLGGCCWLGAHEVGILTPRWAPREERARAARLPFDRRRLHAEVVPRGGTHFYDPLRYSMRVVRRTDVPAGTIGVVIARFGRDPSPTKGLQDHVECSYFQDGGAFLRSGGQRGRQPSVLPGGTSYAIDTELFDVVTTKTLGDRREDLFPSDLHEISIEEGLTGVVIVREGLPPVEEAGEVAPRVEGHDGFQLPHVFLANGGQRGVQQETLTRGGIYRINPWFARVVLVPIRDLTLCWRDRDDDKYAGYDSNLRPIQVNVSGHRILCDVTQTIRIPTATAPRLVGRIGEEKSGSGRGDNLATIRRFVDGVLGQTVEGHLQSTASEQEDAVAFLRGLDGVRTELEDKVRQALFEWDVEGLSTTFTRFETSDEKLNEVLRSLTYEEGKNQQLVLEQKNNEIMNDMTRANDSVAHERRQQWVDESIERRERLLRLDEEVRRNAAAVVQNEVALRRRLSEDTLNLLHDVGVRVEEVLSRLQDMGITEVDPTREHVMMAILSITEERDLRGGNGGTPPALPGDP